VQKQYVSNEEVPPPGCTSFLFTWIRERSRTVRMQGGNEVDYPGVISTLLPTQQMRRYRAGRRAAR